MNISTGQDESSNPLNIGDGEDDWYIDYDVTLPVATPYYSFLNVKSVPIVDNYPIPSPITSNWSKLLSGNWITTQSAFKQVEPNTGPSGYVQFVYEFNVCATGDFLIEGYLHADNSAYLYLNNQLIISANNSSITYNLNHLANLNPGLHTLKVRLKNKSLCANKFAFNLNGDIKAKNGGSITNVNCLPQKTSIFGRIYSDDNNNNLIDNNDNFIPLSYLNNVFSNVRLIQAGSSSFISSKVNEFGYYNFVNIPVQNYSLNENEIIFPNNSFFPIVPLTGNYNIPISNDKVTKLDFLNSWTGCGNEWRKKELYRKDNLGNYTKILDIDCFSTFAYKLEEGTTYKFKYNYKCLMNSVAGFSHYSNTSSNFLPSSSVFGDYELEFTPTSTNIGINHLAIQWECSNSSCEYCEVWFEVVEEGFYENPWEGESGLRLKSDNKLNNDTLSNIVIFPNPTNSENLTFIYQSSKTGNLNYTLINTQGKPLLNEMIEKNQYTLKKVLKLENIPKGLYFLIIEHENTTKIEKIVLY